MPDPVITFEPCRAPDAAREIAKLGALEIGYVIEIPGADGKSQDHWRAHFGINVSNTYASATSRAMAKRALVYRMAELFECAGPAFALIASETRSQAETMERA
jgi:hypothetical protein